MRATCSTCASPIEWGRFEKSGKAVPLDVGPVPDGNLVVVRRDSGDVPIVRIATVADRERGGTLRRAHFASCPQAAEHRRPRSSSRA